MAIRRYQSTKIYDNSIQGTFKGHVSIRQGIDDGTISYKEIVLSKSERLDIIAGREYGDSEYWWVIAAASKIGWGLQIPEGTQIIVPNLNQVINLLYG